MKGFLESLAAVALGSEPIGAARLSQPSRFAPASSAIGAWPGDFEAAREANSGPPLGAIVTDHSPDPPTPQRSAAQFPKPMTSVERRKEPRADEPFAPAAPNPAAAHAPRLARNPDNGAGPARPNPPRDNAGALGAIGEDHRPSGAERVLSALQVAARLPLNDPLSTGGARAAPLSRGIVAGREMAARDERPVIHVTIDRIDVRAPLAPKAASEPRRSRPQPTMSLADYLRESKAGGGG